MKIVVLDGYTENPGDLSWKEFERLGELTVYDRTPAELTAERACCADILYTNKTVLSEDIIKQCKNLKFIGVLATGYNVVDIAAAARAGIPVSNIPSYGTASVAQYTIALLLELCHHVGEHARSVKNGDWTACPDWCYWNYPLTELDGKTMGVIGFGRIGRAAARIAAASRRETIRLFFMGALLCCANFPSISILHQNRKTDRFFQKSQNKSKFFCSAL